MVQAFRNAHPGSREEFLAAFEAMITNRVLAWNLPSDFESLVSSQAERLSVAKSELQIMYWEKTAKPDIEREFSSSYFTYGSLMHHFKLLRMLGGNIPESVLKDAEPFFSRFLDKELRSGFPRFESFRWLLPLMPFPDANIQAKIDGLSVAFAKTKADEFRRVYSFTDTSGPELEFLVSTLVSNGMVDDALNNRMVDRAIGSIANIDAPASIPILKGMDWKHRESEVYLALLLGAANSGALKSFILGTYKVKDLSGIISAIDEKAKLPPHIAFLAANIIQSYEPSEAFATVKQQLTVRATPFPDEEKARAKKTLEDAISTASDQHMVFEPALTLNGNLLRVYNVNFGLLKPGPGTALEDALKLARSALQNPETYHKGYELAAAIYGGKAGIDKSGFGSVANSIPKSREFGLKMPLRGPRRQQPGEYGNALEKTRALAELVMMHKFLEGEFGAALEYKLADEVKALAPKIGPESDPFVVQYFCMAVQAHNGLHNSPLAPTSVLSQDLPRIAAGLVDKLQRARKNPRLRRMEMREELELLESTYKGAYAALFGHGIDDARSLNPEAFTFSAQPRPPIGTTQRDKHQPMPPAQQQVQPPSSIQYITFYLGGKAVEGDDDAPKRMMQAANAKASKPLELIAATTQVGDRIPPGTAGVKLQSARDYAATWSAFQSSVRAVEVYGGKLPESVLEACHLKANSIDGLVIITTANGGNFAIHQLKKLEHVFTSESPVIPHAVQQRPRYSRR